MNDFPILSPERIQALLRTEFIVLRNSRDVIKMGALRRWDAGPDQTCPVQTTFYRRAGMRIVGPEKELATHDREG